MKKLVSLLIVALLLLNAVYAAAEAPMTGGWNIAESTEITDENSALFDKATEQLLGVHYAPIAYLGHQVVAGLNHCFLCKATVVYPDAVPSLVLVYIFEALDGQTEIINITGISIAELANSVELPAE